ncbi:MAG: FAD-dependent 5-carboxymethylaminomethyl-2-thiouridine(34) oxidoreductase MnmC [Pseudomonadota bacterium]
MHATESGLTTPPSGDPRAALVIGGGIAGAAIARALADRGSEVRVLEAGDQPARGASGNPRAVVRPVLARSRHDPLATFYSRASEHARRSLVLHPDLDRPNLCCLAGAHVETEHAHELDCSAHGVTLLDAASASARLGLDARAGFFLHDALTLAPAALCAALLAHPAITLRQNATVAALQRNGSNWAALDTAGQVIGRAPTAVVATGPALDTLAPTLARALHRTTGVSIQHAPTPSAQRPRASLLGPMSLSPTADGIAVYGGHWRNSEPLKTQLAGLPSRFATLVDGASDHRVVARLHTPDRLPLVGPLPDMAATASHFAPLRHGKPPAGEPIYQRDAYVLGALGGRGITSALWCADLLASAVYGAERAALRPLHPLRFLVRSLRRNLPPYATGR